MFKKLRLLSITGIAKVFIQPSIKVAGTGGNSFSITRCLYDGRASYDLTVLRGQVRILPSDGDDAA